MKESEYDEFTLLGFKNIVLAPLFEEFIFRACLINIFVEANIMSLNKCVLILPAFFAIGKYKYYLNLITCYSSFASLVLTETPTCRSI